MRFGPKNVSLDFRDVRFPKGWIRTRLEEELLASGFESSVWCEVAVTVDWEELTLLRELRNNQALRYAKTKSLGLLYPGCSLNLDEFAEDLYGRRVRMERFGKRELTFGKLKEVGANMAVITPENAVEVQVLDREFKELDLSAVLALAFNFLRIGDHLKFQGEADGVQPNNADHWSHRGHSPIAAGTLAARRYTNRIR
jgi:hypothetical protein